MAGEFVKIAIHGMSAMQKALRAKTRQVEIAKQRAVIKTAEAVIKAEQAEMSRVFDRPTRFTLNAFTTTFDKKEITSTVEIKDGYWTRSQNYLATQINSGARRLKAFEIALQRAGVMPPGWQAVPGEGAQMDAFGNMNVGQIRQILSWFDAAEQVLGSTQNMQQKGRDKKRKGTKKQRGFEYFVAYTDQRIGRRSWKNGRAQNLMPGIYMRTFFGFGSAIKPVLIFIRSSAYAKRFRFFEVAQQVVDATLVPEFESALKRESSR